MMVWLSFCDPNRPVGQQFLGVTIVDIHDTNDDKTMVKLAITTAWLYEANPGGDCEAHRIHPSKEDLCQPYVGRLMSKRELELAGLL
jgi:hypothetical protein